MQIVEIPPIALGVKDLESAFEKVFRVETLHGVHGDDLVSVSPWIPRITGGEKRRVVVNAPLNNVPEEVHGFVHKLMGKKTQWIKMTTKQTVNRSNPHASSWEIQNRVTLASIASELVHIAPVFYLERKDDQVYLTGRVEAKAFVPPPFKRAVEDAMANETRANLIKYRNLLQTSDSSSC